MFDRRPYSPTAYDDDWEGQPTQGPFHKWCLGVAVPLLVAGVGVYAIGTQAITYDGQQPLHLHGNSATAFGIGAIAAAIFLLCHYFSGNIYDQAWFAVLGKILSAIVFIAATGLLIVRGFLFGLK